MQQQWRYGCSSKLLSARLHQVIELDLPPCLHCWCPCGAFSCRYLTQYDALWRWLPPLTDWVLVFKHKRSRKAEYRRYGDRVTLSHRALSHNQTAALAVSADTFCVACVLPVVCLHSWPPRCWVVAPGSGGRSEPRAQETQSHWWLEHSCGGFGPTRITEVFITTQNIM